ncbi:YncE family protein [Candidatus Poriferisodalis sp.]|uniref:YncE family protein n=1 Tax=Candidatus Poriferisodalis sp. TaxID=3101277 RepID=UPI003B58E467
MNPTSRLRDTRRIKGWSARGTAAVAVFLAALLALWLGVPSVSNAQSAATVSVELSPGRAVPANTAIDVTVSVSNLEADSPVTFRADVQRYGTDKDECEGSGIGADTQYTAHNGDFVVSATISAQCPVGGPYVLKINLVRRGATPSDPEVQLASSSTTFVVSRYLVAGVTPGPPPRPKPDAWLDPDPRSLDMRVHGEWQRIIVRSDVLLSMFGHAYVYINAAQPGQFASHAQPYSATEPPSVDPAQACAAQQDDTSGWRRAIDQSLWIVACKPGSAVFILTDEFEPGALYRYEFTVAEADDTPAGDDGDDDDDGGGSGGDDGGNGDETNTVTVDPATSEWGVLPDYKLLASGNSTARAIWSDGVTMWVTNLDGYVYAYSLADMTRDASKDISAPGSAGNHHANGVWSDGAIMWVSDDNDDQIYAYDLHTGARVAGRDIDSLDSAHNNHPKGLWSDGVTMWVADHSDDMIYAYDLHTGARRYSQDITGLGSAGNGRAAALWSDGTVMWVSDDHDAKIYAYGLHTGDRKADLDLDGLLAAGNDSPKGIWSNGSIMWVADNSDGRIYAYNMPELTAEPVASTVPPSHDGSGNDNGGDDGNDDPALTAEFVASTVPHAHDGSREFTVRAQFSEPIAVSYRRLRDDLLEVTNGSALKFKRVDGRNDLWEIHVKPSGTGDVTLLLRAATECATSSDGQARSQTQVCTAAGLALSHDLTLTVPQQVPS